MKEIICTVCPKSCHVLVDGNNTSGNICIRGKNHAIAETTNPVRVLTSTIKTNSDINHVVSVKSKKALPKHLIMDAMKLINQTTVSTPIIIGDVLIDNILNTNIDIVATSNVYN